MKPLFDSPGLEAFYNKTPKRTLYAMIADAAYQETMRSDCEPDPPAMLEYLQQIKRYVRALDLDAS